MTTDLLFRDLYHGNGPVNVTAYANDPNCAGMILKCFQGLSYDTTWFDAYWPQVVKAQADGKFEAVGAYDWLVFASSGAEQWADYARVMAKHGGWLPGMLPPIADVERGGNPGATAESIEKCCKAWNAAAQNDGIDTRILYGRSLLNGLHVTDHMGFTDLWTPRYPAGRPPWSTWRTWLGSPPVNGWTLDDVRLVQGSNGTVGAVTHTLGGRSLDTSLWTGSLDELRAFTGNYQPPGGGDDLTPEQATQLSRVERGTENVVTVYEQIYRDSGAQPPLPADFDPMGEWPKGALDQVAKAIVAKA